MLHDLTLAIKHLRRSPLFVVVAVVTLGLGIGLTTTMLTMLDTILHPYVPYRDVERFYRISSRATARWITGFEKYIALAENATLFEGVGASASMGSVLVEARGNATQVSMSGVTGNYFAILDMTPEMGRFFSDGPSGPDEDKVVVSYGFWQQMLAARPIGSGGVPLTVGGRAYTVIGVMPAERTGTELVVRLPGLAGLTDRQRNNLDLVTRLKPGVTVAGAYAELGTISGRLSAVRAPGRQSFQYRLDSMKPDGGRLSDYQVAMAGAAFAILVIACANLANLMLARGLNRRKELSVRLAMGASRGHLIRQLMTECSVVGVLGGTLGVLLATWGVDLLRLYLPATGRWIGFLAPRADWRIFAFALGVTVLGTLVFGLLPAFTASDVSLSEPLKDNAGTATGRAKSRYSALVVAEVGICLVVLMAAGLMIRQLRQHESAIVWSDESGTLSGSIDLRSVRLPGDSSPEGQFANIGERLRTVPGVVELAVTAEHRSAEETLTSDLEGPKPQEAFVRAYLGVSHAYVRMKGLRVVAGRDFEPGDHVAGSVAIVDEWMVERLWPGMNPVGRMVKLGAPHTSAPWVRVVGVVRSALPVERPSWYVDPGVLLVLIPRETATFRRVIVRYRGNAAIVATALHRSIADMFPADWDGAYFYDSDRMRREALRPFAFITRLFTGLGGLSLLLASVGMYGVLAYSVAQRMREFGIRLALGAATRSVFRIVMHDAAVMILAGTAIGAWLAMWAGNLMITEATTVIASNDWVALVTSEAVLLTVCFAACLTPALRASRANPLDIIRAN